jgi:signal transduction histidine kinase
MEKVSPGELLIKSTNLVYFRLAFALVSLLGGICIWRLSNLEIDPFGFFIVAISMVVYNLLAFVLLKLKVVNQTNTIQILNALLLACDILSLDALIHISHGIESDLYFLFLLPVLLASQTFGRRGIFITVFAASLAYLALLIIENANFLPALLTRSSQDMLAFAHAERLWIKIIVRTIILLCVAIIWGLFCENMSYAAFHGAAKLRGQLDANEQIIIESKARTAREQLFSSISSAIRSTLELDEILRTTVAQLSSALGVSRCAIIAPGMAISERPAIWEAIHPADELSHHTFFSPDLCEFILKKKSNYEEISDVGKAKSTLVYVNPASDPEFIEIQPQLSKLRFQSLVIQPIIYGTETRGVLLIGECREKRQWSVSELELVKSVAGQVAIAIEHARLVDQLSRKNRDLMQKNQNLDAKNLELRTVQTELIRQEKMASVGRMVAGIAHELHSPVDFIYANLPYLKEYFDDFKTIINSTEKIPEDLRRDVEACKQKVKYDFVTAELDNILTDLAEGTERIKQIVANLRSFSHIDESERKEVSLSEGIDGTVNMLSQYFEPGKVQIKTQYDKLPPVLCYPAKLNQVWIYLLSHALESASHVPLPQVSVLVEQKDEWIIVSITDNGVAIDPLDQKKVFEPFYTTKPTGQGIGLGLSICQSIVEAHGGQIWFESNKGEGTTFKVKIPLTVPAKKTVANK